MTRISNPFSNVSSITTSMLLLLLVISSQAQAPRPAGRGFAKVDGAKLYYEVKGAGRPLVLIHGGQMDRRMWDIQFDVFAKRFRVVRYDVRGYGKSDAPAKGFSHEDDLYSLLKFLRVDKVSIVGLSLGGRIAVDFALKYPQMVDALVLAGPGLSGYRFEDRSGWAIVEAARDEGFARATEMWLKHPYMAPAMQNPAISQKIRQITTENAHNWLENPLFERDLKPPAIKRLSEIRSPTLIIVGELDVPDIQKIADTLTTGIAGAKKQVIRKAGHIVNMEKPEEFNQVALDFLEQRNLLPIR
ncbi:MAG: alpha/beta fold hydrolase [Blastocatellia bacterium]